jgi:hypothetical protein
MMSRSATPHTKHAARIEVVLDIVLSFMGGSLGVGHAEITASLDLICQENVRAY